jgi:glycerol-3-phosphate dehydrogenase (NAD(P)+)
MIIYCKLLRMNFGLLGGGRWGVAFSIHLGRNSHRVLIYDINREAVNLINKGKHPYMDMSLPEGVQATLNPEEVLDFSDTILLALPTQVIRDVIGRLDIAGKEIVSLSKGLEIGSYKRVSQIVKEVEPSAKVFVLSGPSFAKEVSLGIPTALVLGYERENQSRAKELQESFSSETLRVYLNDDLVGIELGGALKNVMAIACGISDGLGYGNNTRAALITRGLMEMVRVGLRLGAKKDTFYGLAGNGDLILTTTSELSRNRSLGYMIGRGKSVEEALEKLGQVVEGIETVKAVKKLSSDLGVHTPISDAVYRIVIEKEDIRQVVRSLLLNPPAQEIAW